MPDVESTYNRRETETRGAMRRVTVKSGSQKDENWLIFKRPVLTPDSNDQVSVEVAYKLETNLTDGTAKITRTNRSPLSVFFPTERATRLGFLIQGPYRTTLARDNIPSDDEWNQKLIVETAELIVASLQQLKDMNLLTVSLLETLPIRESDFVSDSLFFPIFRKVSQILKSDSLLPANNGTFVSAQNAVLARSDAVRNLLSHVQLGQLFSRSNDELKWLSTEITQDRTPDLRQYAMEVLGIEEVTPDMFARRISDNFLSMQTDEWFIKFYKFLSSQPALWRSRGSVLRTKPILRLQNRAHVNPSETGFASNVYLSLHAETDSQLPIMKLEISQDKDAYDFLKALGVQEYDIIAEVIENVLPKYMSDSPNVLPEEHLRDFAKIEQAYKTDSHDKKKRLREELRETPFIVAEYLSSNSSNYFKPDQLYFGNDDLRLYFEGNPSYAFVNLNVYPSSAQKLFADLGVMDSVRVEKKEKNQQGYVVIYSHFGNHKRGLDGFDPHIKVDGLEHALNHLTPEKSAFIWNHIVIPNADCIIGIVEKSSKQTYENSSREKEVVSDSFGKLLIDTKWLPDADGNMHRPSEISIDDLPELFKKDAQLGKKLNMKISVNNMINRVSSEIGISSEILNGIREASSEVIERIASLLQSPSDNSITYVPTSQDTPFPIKSVSNPERHAKSVITELQNSPDQEYIKKFRNVRTSKGTINPKTWLTEQYRNEDGQVVCQICQEEMPFKHPSGNYYFEAVEMLRGHFTKEYDAQFLALCPECSPKYKTFVKQVPEAMNNLKNQLIDADNSGDFKVPVKLGGSDASIRFVERHWLDIKAILSFYAQQQSQNVENSVPDVNQQKPQTTESSQLNKKKENWNTDSMLQQFFSEPIRFVTYSGIKDLSQVETGKYTITGIDSKGVKNTLSKVVVLFAFPTENMSAVKPNIKKRTSLKDQNLQPIEIHNNRFQVSNKLLIQAKTNNSKVQVVTRSGNVIRGLIQHFDKFVLCMQVGEKEVIVYRHGLYEFSLE